MKSTVENKRQKVNSTLVLSGVIVLIFAASIFFIYKYVHHHGTLFPNKDVSHIEGQAIFAGDTISDRDAWGQTGDFFGGVLNPIISLGALILLFWNVRLTKTELEETRNTLDKQLFESLLFNMINLHSGIIKEIKVPLLTLHHISTSYDYQSFLSENKRFKDISVVEGREALGEVLIFIGKKRKFHDILDKYNLLNKESNYILGHYFRNFYQILKLINSQKITDFEKKKYANIFRAQLSSDELALVFINCLDNIVDDGKFRKLITKFELLEHISFSMDGSDGICIKYIGNIPYKYLNQYCDDESNKTAFGSSSVYSEYMLTNPST